MACYLLCSQRQAWFVDLCSLVTRRTELRVLPLRLAVHCRNRLQSLQRLRATIGSVEPEAIPQKSESPLDSSFLNVSLGLF